GSCQGEGRSARAALQRPDLQALFCLITLKKRHKHSRGLLPSSEQFLGTIWFLCTFWGGKTRDRSFALAAPREPLHSTNYPQNVAEAAVLQGMRSKSSNF